MTGVDARHTIFSQWFGRKVENTFGLQVRNDWVHNGLYRTENRVRTDKNDINACNDEPIDACNANPNLVAVLPADTDVNKFTDTMIGFYVENKIQWADKFRTVLALRGDDAIYDVTNLTPSYTAAELPGAPVVNFAAANSGTATKFLPETKSEFDFRPVVQDRVLCAGRIQFSQQRRAWRNAKGGTDFAGQSISHGHIENPRPGPDQGDGNRRAHFGLLPSAKHVFTLVSPQCIRTAAGWRHRRHGCFLSPSNRYGVEWANYYTPLEHWAFDFDLADSRAFLPQSTRDDAAPNSPGGKRVPEAVGLVASSGVTMHDYKRFSASLRLRAFGPRDLTSDGIYRSKATVLLNAEVRYRITKKWSFRRRSFEFAEPQGSRH